MLLRFTQLRPEHQQRIARIDRLALGQLLFISFLGANLRDLSRALLGRQLADLARPPLPIGAQLIDFALQLAPRLIGLEQPIDFRRIDAALGQLALHEIGPFTNQLDIQHSECVPQKFNLQPLARRVNRDDVEAHRDLVRAIARRKHFRRAPYLFLLALIDGFLRRTRITTAPRLHLDKHQRLAIHRNDIDLCSRRAKIPRNDPIAVAPQILLRRALPAPPQRKLRPQRFQP